MERMGMEREKNAPRPPSFHAHSPDSCPRSTSQQGSPHSHECPSRSTPSSPPHPPSRNLPDSSRPNHSPPRRRRQRPRCCSNRPRRPPRPLAPGSGSGSDENRCRGRRRDDLRRARVHRRRAAWESIGREGRSTRLSGRGGAGSPRRRFRAGRRARFPCEAQRGCGGGIWTWAVVRKKPVS